MDLDLDWSPILTEDPDGTFRVEIVDEDGVTYPVGRNLTRGQAERLVEVIAVESAASRRPAKSLIRDPNFMAATVLTVKRLRI